MWRGTLFKWENFESYLSLKHLSFKAKHFFDGQLTRKLYELFLKSNETTGKLKLKYS